MTVLILALVALLLGWGVVILRRAVAWGRTLPETRLDQLRRIERTR